VLEVSLFTGISDKMVFSVLEVSLLPSISDKMVFYCVGGFFVYKYIR